MADKNSITEHQLDELLQDLYLEENSQTPNNREADFILNQDYGIAPDAGKEKDLISRLQKQGGASGNYWLIFAVTLVIIASFVTTYLLSGKTTLANEPQHTAISSATTSASMNEQQGIAADGHTASLIDTNSAPAKNTDTFDRQKNKVPAKGDSVRVITVAKNLPAQKPAGQAERKLPFLTEKDKQKYGNIKAQMIVALLKMNKGLYTKIPAYKTVYAGQQVTIDGFAIRNVGITNLEYKTFLADLLAQNRNGDYWKCEVMNENWSRQGYPTLAVDYFQDKVYNDFPVVNVSYDAAKLFCQWLEDETKAYILQNNLKLKPLQIRLPFDEEWVFAAREGYVKIVFEKGYNTIYDEAAGLVNRSFTNRVELVKKHAERVDTLYSFYATNRYGWNEKEITTFYNTGIGYYKNECLDTIYINRMKVLGKFGHVSEMVPQKNSTRLWLSGLSWNNKEEYQKLEKEFKANTSSPFVGFRMIVINANDPEYKNPFW